MKTKVLSCSFLFGVLVFAPALNLGASNLHKYHASLTRINYNPKEKIAEITIQLFNHDLKPVLEKFSGKRIDLEKTPEIDKLILSYLEGTFILKDKNGIHQKLVWIGKELEVDSAYVHLQIPLAEGLESTSLQNSIFFESFAKQTNLVISRFDGKKCDLVFVAGDTFKKITFEKDISKGQ